MQPRAVSKIIFTVSVFASRTRSSVWVPATMRMATRSSTGATASVLTKDPRGCAGSLT